MPSTSRRAGTEAARRYKESINSSVSERHIVHWMGGACERTKTSADIMALQRVARVDWEAGQAWRLVHTPAVNAAGIIVFYVSLSRSDYKVGITGIMALGTANFPCVNKTFNGNVLLLYLYPCIRSTKSPFFAPNLPYLESLLFVLVRLFIHSVVTFLARSNAVRL